MLGKTGAITALRITESQGVDTRVQPWMAVARRAGAWTASIVSLPFSRVERYAKCGSNKPRFPTLLLLPGMRFPRILVYRMLIVRAVGANSAGGVVPLAMLLQLSEALRSHELRRADRQIGIAQITALAGTLHAFHLIVEPSATTGVVCRIGPDGVHREVDLRLQRQRHV